MPDRVKEFLARRLAAGSFVLGQVRISAGYRLTHVDDTHVPDLRVYGDPHDAIEIARNDDAGAYRPLKTALNLRHGWQLELRDADSVLLALDFLYPAALGTQAAQAEGKLSPVDLRRTLERQSGMYAVVKKIDDGQIREVIRDLCRGEPGCLRKILWPVRPGLPVDPVMAAGVCGVADSEPILCAEACNLFVAAGRRVVKREGPSGPA